MPSLPDPLLLDIAAYARDHVIDSELAYDTARHCLMDALACGLQALAHPDCTRLLGPIVPGATLVGGARVPGTSYELDPVRAAFNIGAMIRWLEADWGHPSDSLGGILAVADYLSRRAVAEGGDAPTVRDVLTALIKAHEIHGVIALENAFNQVGRDPVVLVRVASSAVTTAMLGGTVEQVINAVSNAWVDDGALRSHRHAPVIDSRKSCAVGDATSRGVWHALNAVRGEMGYPSALPAPNPGFCEVLLKGRPLAMRIIDRARSLDDPADRDHRRRVEAIPRLFQKFDCAAAEAFPPHQYQRVRSLFADPPRLDRMRVDQLMAELVRN